MFKKTYDIKAVPASRPRVTKTGHSYYAGKYPVFRKLWALMTHSDWPAIYAETKDSQEYEYSIKVWLRNHPKSDHDNIAKALEDELVRLKIIPDDNLITEHHFYKYFWSKKDQVEIKIRRKK